MTSFPLKIVTPDGLQFDGQAQEIVVRTTTGDMGILAGHVNCVAPLGMGQATIITEGKKQYALGFVLQDLEKTLTDEDVERIMKKLLSTFQNEYGATLR